MCVCVCVCVLTPALQCVQVPLEGKDTKSVVRLNQTRAATHNICGLCVPRRRCPVVPLNLRLKRESELQDFFVCSNEGHVFSLVKDPL